MLLANYYDGRSARRRGVAIEVEGEVLRILGDGVERRAPLAELRISEPMGSAPRLITFPDGAVCEVHDHAGLAPLLARTGHRDRLVVRWQFNLRWVLASLVVCVALVAAGHRYGVPWIATRAAEHIPQAVLQQLSQQALQTLDRYVFAASEIPETRRHALVEQFRGLRPADGHAVPHNVQFRTGALLGANAMALPDGTIVVTDALVELAARDEELLGVLAHELGHVHHRHGIRLLLQSSIAGLFLTWYLGDVSSLLAAALLEARYSRGLEAEADQYAMRMMRANGISAAVLADILERMETAEGGRPHAAEDGKRVPDYLSSHPPTAERLRVLRGAEATAR
jgi:Zn-dependent protease with chaperone function